MSADNFNGIFQHPITKEWCVIHNGSMSCLEEDCLYPTEVFVFRFTTKSGASAWMQIEGGATEYGNTAVQFPKIIGTTFDGNPRFELCGECFVCINHRKHVKEGIERCDRCGEPFAATDWRVQNSQGTFHSACEPAILGENISVAISGELHSAKVTRKRRG